MKPVGIPAGKQDCSDRDVQTSLIHLDVQTVQIHVANGYAGNRLDGAILGGKSKFRQAKQLLLWENAQLDIGNQGTSTKNICYHIEKKEQLPIPFIKEG